MKNILTFVVTVLLLGCGNKDASRQPPTEHKVSAPVLAPVPQVESPAPKDATPPEVATPVAEKSNTAVSVNAVKIRSGALMAKGALPREAIRRIVHRHINEIKFCYKRGLATAPTLAGRISIKFTISNTGSVQKTAVASSTLKNETVESCISESFGRWTFPKPKDGGVVTVTFPFMLSAEISTAVQEGEADETKEGTNDDAEPYDPHKAREEAMRKARESGLFPTMH